MTALRAARVAVAGLASAHAGTAAGNGTSITHLKRGVVVEIRDLRANQIGRVQRLTVARAKLTSQFLCLNVGVTRPTSCT